jgi:hypothetical protein
MEVVSVGPLRAAHVVWQTGSQAWALTVVCKATFVLAPGVLSLADEQEAPTETDVHWSDDPSRSLHAPSDLAPAKPRADVVLVGSAYARGGAPARSLLARLSVGTIDKVIECYPERVVAADGSVQEGAGFARMSLLYERAAGGPGTANPVGVRRDARDGYGRTQLPNLQQPGARIGRDVAMDPVGFGPIAARWPQRLEKLGRYAASWPPADWASRPLPSEVDVAYFNMAPADQQLATLHDNERIVLENLHHEHARLVASLPGLHPVCFVEGRGAPFRMPMTADTLRIDTDLGTCSVTWRRQLPLDRPDEAMRVVVAMELAGQTLSHAAATGNPAGAPPNPPGQSAEPDDKLEIETIPPVAGPLPAPPPGAFRAPAMPSMMMGGATSLQGGDKLSPASSSRGSMAMPAMPSMAMPAVASSPAPPASKPRNGPQTVVFAGGGKSEGALPFQAQRAPASPPAGVSSPWVSANLAAPGMEPAPAPVAAPPPMVATPALAIEPPPLSVATPRTSPQGAASPWTASASAPSFVKPVAPVAVVPVAAAEAWARPEVSPSAAAAESNDVLELLWFDADSVPRMRRNKAWKPILTALEQRPVDRDLDDPALASEPMEMEDRREVFEILAHAPPEEAGGVDRVLDAAVRKDGKFVAQLAMFAGEMELRFDELEALKATVATAAPFVTPADDGLKSAVEAAKEMLEGADELTPPSVADAATKRVRTAFVATKRSVPETHVVDQTDRVLLAQRRYEKRIVFGGQHLRFLLHTDGIVVPGYLPESLAKKLPMFQRFKVRLVAEVQQQADQYETHHASLRVVALARATARRSRT